jgi:uncharacterized protein (DUF924 family)
VSAGSGSDAASGSGRGWADDVLRFWFEELKPDSWFKRDDAVDRAIRLRFAVVLAAVAAARPDTLASAPCPALAAVIVLDQFPRNMFRGSAEAFAHDAGARAVACAAIAAGHDKALDAAGRLFLCLPFEHSEDAADQARAVALISALGDAEWTRHAEAHKRIIDRFGRFPHRNAALGRATTPEEAAFLRQPGSAF